MARGKRVARRLGAWICFADESGYTLRPAKARTWAPRGNTPTIVVSGAGGRRVSVAVQACYRSGHQSRLFRMMIHTRRTGAPKGFRESDFAALLDSAHQQLKAPIVLVWDGLPGHRCAAMRKLISRRRWLRVYQLPAYTPDLNPTENMWSNLRRSLANLAAGTVAGLARITRNRLKRMQYRPELIAGFLTSTGLRPP